MPPTRRDLFASVAAAASVLLWLGTMGDTPAPEPTEFSFKVVDYESTADLSPFAASPQTSATPR